MPRSKACELCDCFLGCLGMLKHGVHLQLPKLGRSAKHLASGTVQERHEIKRQGCWCQLGNHGTVQTSMDYIHCPLPARFPCSPHSPPQPRGLQQPLLPTHTRQREMAGT